MSEMHIRINKRVFERVIWLIIVLALVVYIVLNPGNGTSGPAVDVTEMQQKINDLQDKNDKLQNEIDVLEDAELMEAEAEKEREEAIKSTPDPEPEPEEEEEEEDTLSGRLSSDWTVRWDGDSLEYVRLDVTNGLLKAQQLDYTLYWETYFEDTVRVKDTFVVKSGETTAELIYQDGKAVQGSLPSTPGETVDTLVLLIVDDEGDIVDRLEIERP